MKHTEQFLRKRKFLTVIPVILYPFFCLIFWALGGGQVSAAPVIAEKDKGLNAHLPDAQLQDGNGDMLSLYAKAAKDSAHVQELRAIEARNFGVDTSKMAVSAGGMPSTNKYAPGGLAMTSGDRTEEKVNQRLALLQRQLDQASTPPAKPPSAIDTSSFSTGEESIKRMQQLLQNTNGAGHGETPKDPELETLNGMLDKIIQIQNPELAKDQLREQSRKEAGKIFTIEDDKITPSLTMVPNSKQGTNPHLVTNRFYTAGSQVSNNTAGHNAIKAIVYTGGKFVSGATLQLMLEEDLFLNGNLVPKGTFIYGTGEVSNERMKIKISSIGVDQSVFKVNISVYDLDAQEGIAAPGAITRDEAKDGAANALQSLNIGSYDPSLGAQAASAGIATAKSLMTKKAKTVYANINAGHHVLLIDQKQ